MSQKMMLSPAFAPEDKIYLQPIRINEVEIDICPKSGGIWFDRFELNKFDEIQEDLTELTAALPQNPTPSQVTSSRRSPRHPQAIMQQQPYGPKGAHGVLTIDKCPICAGVWLDHSEIMKIRELYPTAQQKQVAAQALVKEAFKDFPQRSRLDEPPSFLFSLILKIIS